MIDKHLNELIEKRTFHRKEWIRYCEEVEKQVAEKKQVDSLLSKNVAVDYGVFGLPESIGGGIGFF